MRIPQSSKIMPERNDTMPKKSLPEEDKEDWLMKPIDYEWPEGDPKREYSIWGYFSIAMILLFLCWALMRPNSRSPTPTTLTPEQERELAACLLGCDFADTKRRPGGDPACRARCDPSGQWSLPKEFLENR